jgi:hypothetical protein
MRWLTGLMAAAVGLSATATGIRDGAAAQITQMSELFG